MKRGSLLLVVALLTTGCTYRIVADKTIEQSEHGPQVCVSYRYSGDSSGRGTSRCSDDRGEPLTLRCYADAKVGDGWPDACSDGRLSDRALAIRPVLRGALAFTPVLSLVIGLISGVYVTKRINAPGWRDIAAGFVGAVVGLGLFVGTLILLFGLLFWVWDLLAE